MSYHPGDILLNKYRIEELIGRGAFAEVYRATHIEMNVPRSLKVLHKDAPGVGSALFEDYEQRFKLEVQLGARINHPNVIHVYDVERHGDDLILVMEYAPGGSLAERIQENRALGVQFDFEEALQIAADVAAGLGELHAMDAVHRDLKPSNILFDQKGQAKVVDLGLSQIPGGPSMRSQLSQPTPHTGTPGYMSPEQENTGKYLRPSSDVYALGVVLYELLTGRNYYHIEPGRVLSDIRGGAPRWLDELIARMLTDKLSERPWDGNKAASLINTSLMKLVAERKENEQKETWQKEIYQVEEINQEVAEPQKKIQQEKMSKERRWFREEQQAKRVAPWEKFKYNFSRYSRVIWIIIGLLTVGIVITVLASRIIGWGLPLSGRITPTYTGTLTKPSTDIPHLTSTPTQVNTSTPSETPEPTSTNTPTLTPTYSPTPTVTQTSTPTPLPEGYGIVPNLLGLNYKDAEEALTEFGYSVLWEYGLHPNEDVGTITLQDPTPGSVLKLGDEVTLTRTIYSEHLDENISTISSYAISSDMAFGTKLFQYFTVELEEGRNYIFFADMNVLFSDCGMFVTNLFLEKLASTSGEEIAWFNRCETMQLKFTPGTSGYYGIGVLLNVGGKPSSGVNYENIEIYYRASD
ncbi:MAG: protein kinase [Anaerolineales bacterium]|nr:protein kinase [Chloroflexota bacterium]MBL6981420.1 protein kinase [Anaerolineales bacterium]